MATNYNPRTVTDGLVLALDEFFALSKAHFQVLGRELIDEKFRFFAEHFEDLFTSYWIMMGRMYIYDMGEFI